MLRIDGAYLYDMGAQLRPILSISEQKTTKIEIFLTIQPAIETLRGFLHASVFVPHIRTVRPSADDLLNDLELCNVNFSEPDSFNDEIQEWQIRSLKINLESSRRY